MCYTFHPYVTRFLRIAGSLDSVGAKHLALSG